MSRYNYFSVVSVVSATFPDDPQAVFGFISDGFAFLNRGASVIEYSFDGTTVHGDLNPADTTKGLSFGGRVEDKVWFRVPAGASTVRVEAWGMWGR